jgi:UDP-N-acetylmuramoyl-L-alanyl-D-glutamate--2,6-diaminopimelate ligase
LKLSILVKAIEPIRIYGLTAERQSQHAGGLDEVRYALSARPSAAMPDTEIGSIHYRAQEVLPGGLFVAVKGQTADGHEYIGQALEKQAAVIVVQNEVDPSFLKAGQTIVVNQDPIMIRVPDTRRALADLAARFYNHPSEHLTLIGITGTNGKTTVAYLIESILSAAGFRVGVIGTINYRYSDKTFPNPMTTPESLDLQRILSEMLTAGVTHAVMEASSHAMELYRIRGCSFDVAVFTNLSQDHLDFHGDMSAYWSSKKKLFTEYLNRGPKRETATAVLNCDDPKGRELADSLSIPKIKTGSAPDCDIQAETSRYGFVGTDGRVSTPRGGFDFKTPLVGIHNVANILCAAGAATALEIAPAVIKAGLEKLTAIPGRLERIADPGGRHIYVDYAHTPDALENAISALKAIAPARIICVFGCGGDRDKSKRPLMGAIVARLCDLSIVTSDNPRTEEPASIIAQIIPGIKQAGGVEHAAQDLKPGLESNGYVVEPDRRRAIELAIRASGADDAVLIAGKGHETYQIIGKTVIDFDDREETRKALRAVSGQ